MEEKDIGNKKLLFVFQDANFTPKTLIVPTKEFQAARPNDVALLLKHAKPHEEPGAVVLVQNYVWENGCGTMEMHEWSRVSQEIMSVATFSSEVMFPKAGDEAWVTKSQVVNTTMFDPREVFARALASVKDELSHAFLVLEAQDGVVRGPPPVRDVNEMYETYYSGREEIEARKLK